MRIRAGTSGYSYKQWKGSFYPADLPDARMLSYYATRLGAVEINNTFYRMPTAALLEKWRQQVTSDFTFVLKASQRITHHRRLRECGDDVAYFFETAQALAEQLGPVLFQLPPNMKKDVERLRDFLAGLPPGLRAAFEFRHPSWFDDETSDALRAAGAALCAADTDESGEAGPPLQATADWGYLRLRRSEYSEADLAAWAERVRALPWSEAFVFFKHEDEARGPLFAERFARLASS